MSKVIIWAFTDNSPSLMAGIETFVANLLTELNGLSIKPTVVCTEETKMRLLQKGAGHSGDWHVLGAGSLSTLYSSRGGFSRRLFAAASRKLSRAIGRSASRNRLRQLGLNVESSIFIYCTYGSFVEVAIDASLAGAKVISFVHDLLALRNPERTLSGKLTSYREVTDLRELLRRTDTVVTPSAGDLEVLTRRFKVHMDAYTSFCLPSVPNYGEMPVRPVGLPEYVRDFLFYPSGCHPWKNHLSLVRAMLVSSTSGPIPVICTGPDWDSPHGKKVQSFVWENGLEDLVIHLGFVSESELAWLYQNAIGVLYLGRDEAGFALPIWEGQARGTPVLVSDSPVLREQCGDSVIYSDVDNPEDLAFNMHRIASDGKLREVMLTRGQQHYRAQPAFLLPKEVVGKYFN